MCKLWLLSLASMFLVASGCAPKSKSSPAAGDKPAKVEKLPVETELATVTLTEDAVGRLGIETALVRKQSVAPKRTLGGEAMVPLGRTIVISTPVAGVITTARAEGLPLPGTMVSVGNEVLSVVPLLSPERDVPTPAEQVQMVGAQANLMAARTVAQGDVERSRAEVEAAKIAFERAAQLFQDRAGAKRGVDDAEAQLNIAQSVLAAAVQRESQLAELLKTLEHPLASEGSVSPPDTVSALPMYAPIDGLINRLNVSRGQTVAAGAALFEVVNLDTIWIRVPVFVDLLKTINQTQTAKLVSLSGEPYGAADSTNPTFASPIVAPPTANASASSADLYYQVDNRQVRLRPGQRVGVELPLVGASDALSVPDSAVIYDIYGGAWVYVDAGERHFRRHRITVRWVADGEAILGMGPPIDTPVVIAGAAELFGTEFGTGK